MVLDHMAAEMIALAGVGKLPVANEYLARVRPKPKRTKADMLATLKEFVVRNGGEVPTNEVN